ncbi:MAG: hypothetical protein JWP22_2410, partial [Ramlibacter sp.]|nr:hypothetical protein [Ramlibacter sp.]
MADQDQGPLYTLECEGLDGNPVELFYRPHVSELTDGEGSPLLSDVVPFAFEPVDRVSPASPGWKTREVGTLKIQLGLRCNYSCTYCNQSSAVVDATVTRTADASTFLDSIGSWLQGAPGRIEFWGGEPLLYFAKLKRLIPALADRFPGAVLFLITNGSLLDEEILAFIERWDIQVAVSHDGPGQHLRGPDPFDDPQRAHWLRELWRRRGGGQRLRVSFNVVLTPANADIRATRAWLAAKVGVAHVVLDTEGAVSVYDDGALNGPGTWSSTAYDSLREGIVEGFQTGEALEFLSIRRKAQDFVHSLQRRRPAGAVGQKCG